MGRMADLLGRLVGRSQHTEEPRELCAARARQAVLAARIQLAKERVAILARGIDREWDGPYDANTH